MKDKTAQLVQDYCLALLTSWLQVNFFATVVFFNVVSAGNGFIRPDNTIKSFTRHEKSKISRLPCTQVRRDALFSFSDVNHTSLCAPKLSLFAFKRMLLVQLHLLCFVYIYIPMQALIVL